MTKAKTGLTKTGLLKIIKENTIAANKARDDGNLDRAELLEQRGVTLNQFASKGKISEFPSGQVASGASIEAYMEMMSKKKSR